MQLMCGGGMVVREPFVCNEKGFLLLEHLISMVIMGFLSIAFLSLMQVVSIYSVSQTSLTMHGANSLAIRLQNEIQFADSLKIADGQLLVHFPGERGVVSFFAQNNRLIRQVDGRGGEIMIYNVARMNVILVDNRSARVSLTSTDGDVYQFHLQVLHMEVNRPEIREEGEIDDG